MAEMALYRKYRPKTFKDVVGQGHVISALQGALKEGARILAHELGASDSDIHEIDAATYTGVDNIRALREEAATMPFESKRKVYIVDEVHMLSKGAFNAFLKLLEEPPSHVSFILATTELEKVPDTIQSRCQVFTFKKPIQKDIVDMVTKIAKVEGFTIEKSSAELIALLADGSFRDSQSILQKILSSSKDKKVSIEEVIEITGAPRIEIINTIIAALAKGDSSGALTAVRTAVEQNADIGVLLMILIDRVRMLLMTRYAPQIGKGMLADLSDIEQKMLADLAADAKSKINSDTLRKLLIAVTETPRSPVPELPLELAIMELVGPAVS